jgi:hypothetical protein
MNKKTKIAVAFTILALGGAYLVYNRYFNKNRFVKIIVSKVPNLNESALKNMDLGYLRGRAFGLKNNDVSFKFKGKTYSTKDGKLIR